MDFKLILYIFGLFFIISPTISDYNGSEQCTISDDMTTQLHHDIHALDNEIEFWRQEIYHKIKEANKGVEESIERTNLAGLLAASLNGFGGLLQIYATAFSATELDTPTILRLIARGLRRGTQVSGGLRKIKPVAQDCGIYDYEHVVNEYAVFFHLYSLYNEYSQLDPVEYHPDVLKIMSCEFGNSIKENLSCLTTTSSGKSLNMAIDQLVLAINSRLDFTKKVIDFA